MTVLPPDSCTLSANRLDERLADWQRVLSAVLTAHRPDAYTVVVTLAASQQVADVAALCAQEVQCCSFFTFGIGIAVGGTTLTISVPPSDVGALPLLVGLLPTSVAEGLVSSD